MYGGMKVIARDMQKVVRHDVAPTMFLLKLFKLWQGTALATVVFVVVIVAAVFLAPLLKAEQLVRIRKNDLKVSFFFY